jgi:hypothetical protein
MKSRLRKTMPKTTLKRLIVSLAVAGLLSVPVFDVFMHASHASPHAMVTAVQDSDGAKPAAGVGCHGDRDHSGHNQGPSPIGDGDTDDGVCTCCAAAHCFVFLAPAANPINRPWTIANVGDAKSVYVAPTPHWRLDRPPKLRG